MALKEFGSEDPLKRNKISSLDKWLVFNLMNEEFVHNIRSFIIYGKTGNEMIVVTKDDVVFHMNVNEITQMTELSELRGQNVIKISSGTNHLCALTSAGDVYTWGENIRFQLGNGTDISSKNPMKVDSLIEKSVSIVDMDCGDCFTLALTSDGQVYAWGWNSYGELGVGYSRPLSLPQRVFGHLTDKRVTSIACGLYHSLAVTIEGDVFAWGYNNSGSRGLGHTNDQFWPVQISSLKGIKVTKVVAGCNYTIILTNNGCVYTFGFNHGQLGTGNKTTQTSPFKLPNDNLDPFVDIATHKNNFIAAAVTSNGVHYVWGECRKPVGLLLTPTVANVTTMYDVFGLYGKIRANNHLLTAKGLTENLTISSQSPAFDDPITSTFQFVIDGHPIHVHREYLIIRCDVYMRRLLDTNQTKIEISNNSYFAFKAFLRYLYTNDVFVAPDIAVELLGLADTYAETDLKRKCTRIISKSITVENVAIIYGAAVKHSAPVLQEMCFKYCVQHFDDVKGTQAYDNLDPFIRIDFLIKFNINASALNSD
ncbi:unnamed protein product [Medioppia subpectinata]|uniref:BTB domain-containing protein n=1 Tax=Medioppia subpectinata TaxID=1979941 RepID=A0A7R9Q107_9ACAR|nr:unnamed protein product [Medioppia subpectinata]CAG2108678.1 unnamed protein product [Medioppia subpectinata]